VRVLPFGALKGVDFHALPFDGDILLAWRPVVYGLDVQTPVAAPRQRTGTLRALVLADPRGDLPDARGEARDVGRALGAHGTGWSAEILPEATDEGALYGRLGGCDLFHYAGHAQSAGAGGWESMLLLAHDTSLTLADLLALPRSPAWVVLSGCDTGRQAGAGSVEVPSLAHAFLLAGARGVIAAVRPIGDRAARDFSARFYRDWAGEPDLAARLRRTQLALRAANPAAAWQSFRLFEP
jgi:CHAT domain-containing protein